MSTIAIIRNREKREESIHLAEELGWTWRYASPTELTMLQTKKLDQFLDDLLAGKARSVVLSNVHSLRFLLQALQKSRKAEDAVRALNRQGVVAVGSATAEAARKEWIKVEVTWDRLPKQGLIPSNKLPFADTDLIWLVCSFEDSAGLLRTLQGTGARVEDLAIYSRCKREPDRELLDAWFWTMEGDIDAFAFTSPANVEAFVQGGERRYNMRDFGVALNSKAIGALDEATGKTLERMGFEVDLVAEPHTFESLLHQLKNYLEKGS